MDLPWIITTALSLLAIIATVIYGRPALQAYLDNRNSKLFFFEKYRLMLYEDVIKNVPNLEITFKGNKVLTNMFILKGIFICSGKKAVNLSEHDDGIIVTINEDNAMWHAFDVTKKTNHLTINHSILGQDLTIKFKQLKDRQYFVIECLGQADQPSLTFNNMIGNVDGIIQEKVGVQEVKKSNLFSWIGIWVVTLAFMWISVSNLTNSYRLKPTYYNNKQEVIVTDSVFVNLQQDYAQSGGSRYADSGVYSVSYKYQLLREKDSVSKLAANGNYDFTLLLGGKTDTLRVSPNFLATYTIDYKWSDLILILPILFFVVSLLILISIVRDYIRFKNVAALATQVLR